MKKKRPSFTPKSKNEESIKLRSKTYMSNFSVHDDPEREHQVHTGSTFVSNVPIQKTQEEIDRMWEYNKMFGRT